MKYAQLTMLRSLAICGLALSFSALIGCDDEEKGPAPVSVNFRGGMDEPATA